MKRWLIVWLLMCGVGFGQVVPPGGDTIDIDVSTLVTNGGATINGAPITNGAAFTITGGGTGGGLSNIVVAGVAGTISGSGSNVVASVSLADLAGAGVVTNGQHNVALGTNVTMAGNLGVGVTPPVTLINAAGTGSNTAYASTGAATFPGSLDGGIGIYINNNRSLNGSASYLGLSSKTTGGQTDASYIANVAGTGSSTNIVGAGMAFGMRVTASTPTYQEMMRITSDGNVGVGTNAPAAKLHVNGSVRVEGATTNVGPLIVAGGGNVVTNGGATINGSPITNGAAFTITGGGGGGGLSNIVVAGVSGTLSGSGSNVVSSVSLASLAGAGVATNAGGAGDGYFAMSNGAWTAFAPGSGSAQTVQVYAAQSGTAQVARVAETVTGVQSNRIEAALTNITAAGIAAAGGVTGGVFSVGTSVSNVNGTLYIPTNLLQGATGPQGPAGTNGADGASGITNAIVSRIVTYSTTNPVIELAEGTNAWYWTPPTNVALACTFSGPGAGWAGSGMLRLIRDGNSTTWPTNVAWIVNGTRTTNAPTLDKRNAIVVDYFDGMWGLGLLTTNATVVP